MASRIARWVVEVLIVVATVVAATGASASAVDLTDGDSSAGWQVVFAGYGSVTVGDEANKQWLTLRPATAGSADQTHAALVVSQQIFTSSRLRTRATLNAQLRSGTPANPWETGWLVTHYSDPDHFYYLALKTNGWELGKRDPAYTGGQRFLATGSTPAASVGEPQNAILTARGNRLVAKINGKQVAALRDTQRAYTSGQVGFYSEDADVTFDRISL